MQSTDTCFYKLKNQDYYDFVKAFFSGEHESDKEFFCELHNKDVNEIIKKHFSLKVTDIGKMWGIFHFQNYYDQESQSLKINSFDSYQNIKYKKALQMINYLHETTHEKQRDFFMFNNKKHIKEATEYNKLLNLEIFCNVEAKLPNYEQLLTELDAIHNSILLYTELMHKGCLPKSQESLSVVLYACVRYIASLNLEKHHTYYPENFTLDSDNLIKYHKDFYDNLVVKHSYSSSSLKDVILESENLSIVKTNELLNIDFNKIQQTLDAKTQQVFEILKTTYKQIIKTYKPSNQMLNTLNASENNFDKIFAKQNIVKNSALICDDLHKKYTKTNPLLLSTTDEQELCL